MARRYLPITHRAAASSPKSFQRSLVSMLAAVAYSIGVPSGPDWPTDTTDLIYIAHHVTPNSLLSCFGSGLHFTY
jgi:hypothetical protein